MTVLPLAPARDVTARGLAASASEGRVVVPSLGKLGVRSDDASRGGCVSADGVGGRWPGGARGQVGDAVTPSYPVSKDYYIYIFFLLKSTKQGVTTLTPLVP